MKLLLNTKAVLLGATRNDYINKAGKPTIYCEISLKQGSAVGTLRTTPELHTAYQQGILKDFAEYTFSLEYVDNFKSLVVVGVNKQDNK